MSTSWQLALVGLVPVPLIVLGSLGYQRLISPRYQVVRERVGPWRLGKGILVA